MPVVQSTTSSLDSTGGRCNQGMFPIVVDFDLCHRPRQHPGRSGVAIPAVSVWIDTTGRQSRLTGMDIEKISVSLSSDDPAVGLRASLALHRLAERVEANHVASAREKGWSWQQIGDALGVTRQSVHTKYNKESS